jgi:lipid-binding SYLF domain-containing protein
MDLQLRSEILTYSRSRGAFAGVSLDGQMFKQDGGSNEKLNGRKIALEDILFKGVVLAPVAAQPLDTALTQFSPKGGLRGGRAMDPDGNSDDGDR